MRNAFIVGALLLATGVATAIPLTSTPNVIAGTGAPTEQMLIDFLGGTHPDTVRIIQSDGVVKVVSWEEHLVQLSKTSFGNQPGADAAGPVCTSTWLCGSDEGQGIIGSGFFCDNSSAFILYDSSLTVGGPGSAWLASDSNGVVPLVTCGGFYGPTEDWSNAQLSIYPVLTGMLPRVSPGLDGCFATLWTTNPDGYCPKSFTGPDTFGVFTATGTGVKVGLDYGGGFFLDYFMGNGASVSYGPTP